MKKTLGEIILDMLTPPDGYTLKIDRDGYSKEFHFTIAVVDKDGEEIIINANSENTIEEINRSMVEAIKEQEEVKIKIMNREKKGGE